MQSACHEYLLKIPLFTESDTITCARMLAPYFKQGDTVLLSGNLGMGKTVFARAVIRSIVNDPSQNVTSPTYTLVNEYEDAHANAYPPIRHYDLYRLEHPDDVYDLGWDDNGHFLCLVEWPEKLNQRISGDCWHVSLIQTSTGRELRVTVPESLPQSEHQKIREKLTALHEASPHV